MIPKKKLFREIKMDIFFIALPIVGRVKMSKNFYCRLVAFSRSWFYRLSISSENI